VAHDDKTKKAVRHAYVFDCVTLELAAEKAGVSFGTARRWKKQAQAAGDDWDKVRDAHTLAGGKVEDVARGMLTTFVLYFEKLMDELKQSEDLPISDKAQLLQGLGDSYTKMVAASKRLVPEVSEFAAAMRTVKRFGEHVQSNKPQLLNDFLDLLDSFGPVLDKEFRK